MIDPKYVSTSHTVRWHQHHKWIDPEWDPFLEQYRHHLRQLDLIVQQSNELIEGSVIYEHCQHNPGVPAARYLPKRRFLAQVAQAHSHMLEIGFNAGHAALIMLTANPQLRITAVDIAIHQYTIPCYNYLKSQFGERITFLHSDSSQVWPMLALTPGDWDFVHIDGCHEPTHCEVDLVNSLHYTKKGTRILVDDIDFLAYLRPVVDVWRLRGAILPLVDQHGLAPGLDQGYYLNNLGRAY